MNVLTLEDLLEVSMFKCKICCRRLQCPVLQVGLFGNICEACYERSVFTDVIPNIDVETLLAKLQVPCNFKERGCTYDGLYYKTCKHEKVCEFRDKICPFAYLGTCDYQLRNFDEIPPHILSCHEESVLLGKMNCPIQVPNPTRTNPNVFYLLNMDARMFLLRTWIDSKGEFILYTFYYLKNDIDLKNIKISFNIRFENTVFNVTGVNVDVRPASTLESACDVNNVVKISTATLMSLNSLENVEILITLDETLVEAIPPRVKNQSVWIKCPHCSKANNMVEICNNCGTKVCTECSSKMFANNCCIIRPGKLTAHNWKGFYLFEWEFMFNMPCENSGCDEILEPNEFEHHKELCLFKKYACPVQSGTQCNWQGSAQNMANHMSNAHLKLINQNTCTVRTSGVLFFFKDGNVFKQQFDLSSNGDLSLTTSNLTDRTSDKSYKWEIRLKRKDTPMMMVITDLCTEEGHQKTVNVKNYINKDGLILYADVNAVGECVS